MEPSGNSEQRPGPGQAIVIERKDRAGCLRRMVWPMLFFSVFLNLALLPQGGGLTPTLLEERYVAGKPLTQQKIAVIEVHGIIIDGNVDHVLRQVRQAREDHQVKAIVLRVDSPGGTVSGSDRIWRELATLKDERDSRPLVVSMGGIAASGGYYVAAQGDYIFAEPTTWTGSIGVIMQLPQLKGLMDKLGIGVATIATNNEWKDSGSPFKDLTPAQDARWREVIDDAYQRFVRVVAQGRGMPLKQVYALANGKVYTAHEALNLNLVNELGYLDDAIRKAQALAKIESARVIRYSQPLGVLGALLRSDAKPDLPAVKIDPETVLRLQTPQMLYLAH